MLVAFRFAVAYVAISAVSGAVPAVCALAHTGQFVFPVNGSDVIPAAGSFSALTAAAVTAAMSVRAPRALPFAVRVAVAVAAPCAVVIAVSLL